MKHLRSYRAIVAIATMLIGWLPSLAHYIEVDGIYYSEPHVLNGRSVVGVTYRGASYDEYDEYKGDISIPESIIYNGRTYSVTSIDVEAFAFCSELTSVTIPNSVTHIGEYAFSSCYSLTNVKIGSNVTYINDGAFVQCTSLSNVEIPEGVSFIGASAFRYCVRFTSIKIPSSVISIGTNAFDGCVRVRSIKCYATLPPGVSGSSFPNETIYVPTGSRRYYKSKTTEWRYYDIQELLDEATNHEIGAELYKDNFYFRITKKNKEIQVFERDTEYSSQEVVIPSAVNYGGFTYDVTGIREGVFEYSNLKSIEIPNSVTSIGHSAFSHCLELTSIEIPNSVISIGSNAFDFCRQLELVKIGNSVKSIGNYAFSDCIRLTSIEIPNSVESIGDYAFENCEKITNDIIANGLKSIGQAAFSGCSKLQSVEFPNLESIGNGAFQGCESLASANVGNITCIGEGAFYYCTNLYSVKLPNNVTSIGGGAFYSCDRLTEINIPNSVTSIGNDAFSGCNNITCILNLNNVTSIGASAFVGCKKLTDVTLGNKIKVIEPAVFKGCSGLSSIEIPNSVTSIGGGAFENCTGLTNVTIGNSVRSVGGSAFKNCTSLTNIQFPSSVIFIEHSAFSGCKSLTSIIIGEWVSEIGEDSFGGCSSLYKIICLSLIPPAVTSSTFSNYEADLYVPAGCSDAYKYRSYWNNFNKIFELAELATSITLDRNEVALNVNGTTQLIATVGPADATEKSVTWKSSNTSVATVDANGKVTAVNFGDATITATTTDGSNLSASCKIRVTALATSITLNKTTAKLNVPETITLTATVLPTTTTDKSVTWKSSNEAVATVDANGKVTAVAVGEATITATTADGSNLSASCKITVSKIPAESITLNKTVASIKAAETITLIATVLPSNTSNKSVTWKSSNTSVATVDANGKVTAVAVGESTITATTVDGSNLSASCKITVVKTLVESITLNKTTASLKVTETVQLAATVYPSTATNKSVTWKSSNTSVATVNSNGKVTAVSMGEATITATTADGSNKSATCMITVVKTPANSITLSQTTASLKANETVQLTATVYPSTATNKSVTWKSSKTSVATVDANGKVTAVSVGEATITATTADGSNMSATCKITVVKTLAESIALNTTTARLNVAETITLTATILPSTTTNKSVTWKSSNTSVATVNANGNVTAIGVGEATITATTTDGTNLSATCNVTVKEMLSGDVNDDAIINVTDVMTVVSHILGFSPDIFIFNAADINKDSKISITDIVAIVNIILNGERANDAPYITRAASHVALGSRLFVDDCSIEEGETMQLAVNLTNDIAFSGFQADIKLPEGLELCQEEGEYMISLSDRKGKDHVLTSAMRPDGTIRLLSYSMNLKEYAGTEGALIYLTVKAADNFVGDYEICINNITFVQANLTEYTLEPTVCHLTGTTEIEGVNDDVVVATIGDDIVVKNAPLGSSVRVYAADGGLIASKVATDGDVVVEAPAKGVYIVVVDVKSFKLMVK